MKKLTVFTPTYNREQTLPKLYESLINQSNPGFCWLVVDDGSTDGTEQLVQNWQKQNKIEITYIKQKNAGKMQAHNTGVLNTKTQFFVCVDSDDFLRKDAIDKILLVLPEVEKREDLCGIVAYKGKSETEEIGNKFPAIAESSLEGLYDNGFKGDTTLVYKTGILKKYLFPKFENEKFIPEAFVYTQIDQKYKLKVLPEICTICEYLEDGLTKNKFRNFKNNAYGMSEYYNLRSKYTKKLKNRVKWVIGYICYALIAKRKWKFKNASRKFLYIVLFPFGLLLSLKRRRVK